MGTGTPDIRTNSGNPKLIRQRRAEIVREASRLFIANGYHPTTMADLAKALGVSKAGVYYYVGSKDDVLRLILRHNAEVQSEGLLAIGRETDGLSAVEALRLTIRRYLEHVDENQDMQIFASTIATNLNREDREMLFETARTTTVFFENLLQRGIDSGEFNITDLGLAAFDMLMLLEPWATRRWLLRQRGYDLDRYIAAQTYIIVGSMQRGVPDQSE